MNSRLVYLAEATIITGQNKQAGQMETVKFELWGFGALLAILFLMLAVNDGPQTRDLNVSAVDLLHTGPLVVSGLKPE